MWPPQHTPSAPTSGAAGRLSSDTATGRKSVASLAKLFESGQVNPELVGKQPLVLPRSAGQSSGASDGPSSSSSLRPQQKRRRLDEHASEEPQAVAQVERELWPAAGGPSGEVDAAAKEARLEKIRARFGTKRFFAPHEPTPEELLELGAGDGLLTQNQCQLVNWESMPVVLSGTSNAYCLNWVLSGQSGCVGLASSITHLYVLGAGKTIYIEDADAVHAQQDEQGVYLKMNSESDSSGLMLKVPDAALAAKIVQTVNSRAAMRQILRSGADSAAQPAAPSPAS